MTLGWQNYSFEDCIDANKLFLTSKVSWSDLVERQIQGERMYSECCKIPQIPSVKQYHQFLECLIPKL